MPWQLPDIEVCCGCVTDLRTAAAIIAVLGIVTSPAVSWAAVRHSYVIRVSCFVTTSDERADVVDINLNNVLSFGFGANAGLGPSCLAARSKKKSETPVEVPTSHFVEAVKYVGWVVLLVDLIFLICSIYFLYMIFKRPSKSAAKYFICVAGTSIILSFLYGILYVTACISVGGAFPIFEIAFCLIDVLVYSTWLYFIIVIRSYILKLQRDKAAHAVHNTTLQDSYLNSFYSWWNDWLSYFGRNLEASQVPGRQ